MGGQAAVNESLRRMVSEAGATVISIDLSAGRGSLMWRKVSRIPKVVVGVFNLLVLLAWRRADAVYIGVAGGYGQLYDTVFASLTRLFRVRMFLHHGSYAYLAKRRRLTATLVRTAGPAATHIVLCADMGERLIALYSRTLNVTVISNSTNIEPPNHQPKVRSSLRTIGFISHITRSKGVFEFLDVAERVCGTCQDVRALLAGPIEDSSIRPVLMQRLRGASWLTYIGPVGGETKSRFYAEIDAFVFPTRHADEADPRVINEALAHGVAVIARGRGCISSAVNSGGGTVVREDADFVEEAERQLIEWHQNPVLFSSVSSAALANAARLRAEHLPRLDALISALVSLPSPAPPPSQRNDDGSRGNESSR